MTADEQAQLDKFEGDVGEQQGRVADLVNAGAPAARVRTEMAKLKKMAPPVKKEMPRLDRLKVAVVQSAIFGLKFQWGEQQAAADELIRGADQTSDAVDLDSWDYEDEDAAPPPSAVRED